MTNVPRDTINKLAAIFAHAPWLKTDGKRVHIAIVGMDECSQITWPELYVLTAALSGTETPTEKELSLAAFRAALKEAHRNFMATGVSRDADEKFDDMAAAIWSLVADYIEETENRIIDAEFKATEATMNAA